MEALVVWQEVHINLKKGEVINSRRLFGGTVDFLI